MKNLILPDCSNVLEDVDGVTDYDLTLMGGMIGIRLPRGTDWFDSSWYELFHAFAAAQHSGEIMLLDMTDIQSAIPYESPILPPHLWTYDILKDVVMNDNLGWWDYCHYFLLFSCASRGNGNGMKLGQCYFTVLTDPDAISRKSAYIVRNHNYRGIGQYLMQCLYMNMLDANAQLKDVGVPVTLKYHELMYIYRVIHGILNDCKYVKEDVNGKRIVHGNDSRQRVDCPA